MGTLHTLSPNLGTQPIKPSHPWAQPNKITPPMSAANQIVPARSNTNHTVSGAQPITIDGAPDQLYSRLTPLRFKTWSEKYESPLCTTSFYYKPPAELICDRCRLGWKRNVIFSENIWIPRRWITQVSSLNWKQWIRTIFDLNFAMGQVSSKLWTVCFLLVPKKNICISVLVCEMKQGKGGSELKQRFWVVCVCAVWIVIIIL